MDSPGEDEVVSQYLNNIFVPSALIEKEFGDHLKKAVDENNMANIQQEALSHPDARVEYEIWDNSNDECGAKCDAQTNFVKTSEELLSCLRRVATPFSHLTILHGTAQRLSLVADSASLNTLTLGAIVCHIQSRNLIMAMMVESTSVPWFMEYNFKEMGTSLAKPVGARYKTEVVGRICEMGKMPTLILRQNASAHLTGNLLYNWDHDTCLSKKAEESKAVYVAVMIILVGLCIDDVGTYVVHKCRLRAYMDSEVRAIMAQYMLLESQEEVHHHAEERCKIACGWGSCFWHENSCSIPCGEVKDKSQALVLVTKLLECFLNATFIWLAKLLSVKSLASSIHVATFCPYPARVEDLNRRKSADAWRSCADLPRRIKGSHRGS
ncbi:hypothetical protein L7F22_037377 [Adiantum nelumboides]|nr:hypothetical protein [Adiantum nelumboides]